MNKLHVRIINFCQSQSLFSTTIQSQSQRKNLLFFCGGSIWWYKLLGRPIKTAHPRSALYRPPRVSGTRLTLTCSCSCASCWRESCSCCRWNSAIRSCLWICCFCLRARSSCCSCCSRWAESVGARVNWWSTRRSMGMAEGGTCSGSAALTSTAETENRDSIKEKNKLYSTQQSA